MPLIPLPVLIFQGIPECIAILFLSCKVLKVGFHTQNIKKLLLFGIIQAGLAYFLRFLTLAANVGTIALTIVLCIWTYLISQRLPQFCILSSTIAVVLLVAFETFFMCIFQISFNDYCMNISQKNYLLMILWGWPQIIMLFLSGVIFGKVNIKALNFYK